MNESQKTLPTAHELRELAAEAGRHGDPVLARNAARAAAAAQAGRLTSRYVAVRVWRAAQAELAA